MIMKLDGSMHIFGRYKRTALTHAVMNGAASVASFLLRKGADPNGADTSGTNCIKIGLSGKLILSKRKGLWEVLFS